MTEEEQKAVASQEAQPSQEQKQEASEQVPDPKIQEELERKAQSEADKRVKVFERKLEDIQAEHRVELRKLQEQLDSERKAAEVRREEEGLDGFLNKYVQTGDLTESGVPPIKDWAKRILDRNKQAEEKERKAIEALSKAEETAKEVAELKTTKVIQKLAKELDVSLSFDDAEVIAKKTQGNVDWATDLIRARVTKVEQPEKPKPKRPDSSAPTAPGGKLSDTELRQQYAAGKMPIAEYEKECKARGISPA